MEICYICSRRLLLTVLTLINSSKAFKLDEGVSAEPRAIRTDKRGLFKLEIIGNSVVCSNKPIWYLSRFESPLVNHGGNPGSKINFGSSPILDVALTQKVVTEEIKLCDS